VTDASEWTVPVFSRPCPRCGDLENRHIIFYTLWGGVIGGLLMNARYVKCGECRTIFNKVTGARSYWSMIVSLVLLALVAIGVGALLFMG
jgi:hypothetical protein